MTAETIDTVAAPRSYGLGALLPFIASKRTHFIITVVSGVLAQIATVVAAVTGAWLVGHAVQGAAPHTLVGAFWVLGIAVVAAASCKWWQMFISHDFAYGLIEALQVGIYDGLERAAPAYVLGRRTGDLASVATSDADLMEWFYAHVLGDYIGAVIVPLGALATLAVIHPLMALVLLPFLPLVASVPFWLAKRAGEQGRQLLAALGLLNAEVVEGVQGLRELAVFGAGRIFLQKLMRETRLVHVIQMRYGVRAGAEQAAIDVLLALAVLATVTTGLWLVSTGRLGFALYPMAVVLAGAALAPIPEVTHTARKLGELRAGADRVVTIFHQHAQVADRGARTSSAIADGSVRFDHVGFGYGGGAAPVLDGHETSPGAGRDRGAGRPLRRRQDHLRQPALALLGCRHRHDPGRRLRCARCAARPVAPQRDAGAAGRLSLQRQRRRQHPARPAGGDAGRDRARRGAGPGA